MSADTELMPVRGADAIEILLHDHETIKGLLEHLIAAKQKSERKSVLEQLKAALTVHNATEENIVYPAINKVARKRAESEHLYHETAEADVVLFELDGLLKEGTDSDFAAKAKKFQGAVLEHIQNEETSAFPHLREKADAKEAKSLTASVRAFRKSIHFETD